LGLAAVLAAAMWWGGDRVEAAVPRATPGGAAEPAAAVVAPRDRSRDREVVAEVLGDEAFEVRVVKFRDPERKERRAPGWFKFGLPAWMLGARQLFSTVLTLLLIGAAGGALAWLLQRYRHLWKRRAAGKPGARPEPVVMAVAIAESPAELPTDPPAVAMRWWYEGRRREALAMLYRAAISWFVERRQLEIGPAVTEDDCVRRVRRAEAGERAEHFRRLTTAWVMLAYGGRDLEEREWLALCESWPYRGEGAEG
jgi:hypothetical protein